MNLNDAEEKQHDRDFFKARPVGDRLEGCRETGADDDREDTRGRNLSAGDIRRDPFLDDSSRDLGMFTDTLTMPSESTPGLVGTFSACPEMPAQTDMLATSDRVELVLRRTKAFSEDSDRFSRRFSSMDISCNSRGSTTRFRRIDSQLLDAKCSSDYLTEESPKATWVYWEENIEQDSSAVPFREP